jgi:hypothetical protein
MGLAVDGCRVLSMRSMAYASMRSMAYASMVSMRSMRSMGAVGVG